MPKVVLATRVGAIPELPWRVLRDFSQMKAWHPLVTNQTIAGSGIGAIRYLEFSGLDGLFVERLERRDDIALNLAYSVDKCPLPVQELVVEVSVTDEGDGTSTISWSGEFAADSTSEVTAVRELHRLFNAGLSQLEIMFEPRETRSGSDHV